MPPASPPLSSREKNEALLQTLLRLYVESDPDGDTHLSSGPPRSFMDNRVRALLDLEVPVRALEPFLKRGLERRDLFPRLLLVEEIFRGLPAVVPSLSPLEVLLRSDVDDEGTLWRDPAAFEETFLTKPRCGGGGVFTPAEETTQA